MGKKLGGDTAGTQVTPTNKRDILELMAACSVIKADRKKEEGTALMERRRKEPHSGLRCLSSHVTVRPDIGLLS